VALSFNIFAGLLRCTVEGRTMGHEDARALHALHGAPTPQPRARVHTLQAKRARARFHKNSRPSTHWHRLSCVFLFSPCHVFSSVDFLIDRQNLLSLFSICFGLYNFCGGAPAASNGDVLLRLRQLEVGGAAGVDAIVAFLSSLREEEGSYLHAVKDVSTTPRGAYCNRDVLCNLLVATFGRETDVVMSDGESGGGDLVRPPRTFYLFFVSGGDVQVACV
jgi:hypothetical protein